MLHFQKTTKLMSLEVFFLFRNLEKRNRQMPMKTKTIKVKRLYQLSVTDALEFYVKNSAWKVFKYGVFFWSVILRVWSKYRKIRTRKITYMNTFHAVKNIETCELQEEFGNGIVNSLLKLWKYESYHKLINQNKHCTKNQVFHWWFL